MELRLSNGRPTCIASPAAEPTEPVRVSHPRLGQPPRQRLARVRDGLVEGVLLVAALGMADFDLVSGADGGTVLSPPALDLEFLFFHQAVLPMIDLLFMRSNYFLLMLRCDITTT